MKPEPNQPIHPFITKPHRTFLLLSVPVLFSMIAEPVTGLVDTAFVARLGAEPLAALGVGTMLLSGIFWVFNFLSVGTQTEVGQALGRQEQERAAEIAFLAVLVGFCLGMLLIVVFWWMVPPIVTYMGATDAVHGMSVRYVTIRLFGAPAVLITLSAFGVLRGCQDMRTPLWIAVLINLMNILLDAMLIFGTGPIPAFGIAGAAYATTFSQWLGAAVAVLLLYKRLSLPRQLRAADIKRLIRIGGDMFVRTGLLLFYLLMATRTATRISPEAGAAHQAIRQFWTFTALFLDAYSITAQSLIAYFIGTQDKQQPKRVARVICLWSVITGFLLTGVMVAGQGVFARLLVPPEAVGLFAVPWLIAAFSQPINAIAFATDGIHWGTGDFAYLRNGMIVATSTGLIGIFLLEVYKIATLEMLWVVTAIWITARAVAGTIRVWPGIGHAPLSGEPA
ncbi:MAG: MATE family efflux transporter [bacterium]